MRGAMAKHRFAAVFVLVLLAVLATPRVARCTQDTQAMVDGLAGTKINTANGNLYLQRTDLAFAGSHLPISLVLSYNSLQASTDRGFGNGWQLNYNVFYTVESDGDVIVARGDGRLDRFDSLGGGAYRPPAGVFDTLTVSGSGFLLTTKHQTKYYMDSASHTKLTRIVDENNNTTTLTYNGSNQLIAIVDPVGRRADLTWSSGHLSSARDVTTTPDREVTFTYTSNNLTRVSCLLAAGVWAQTDYSYNAASQLTGFVTPEGEDVRTEYETVGGALYRVRAPALNMGVTVYWDTALKRARVYGWKGSRQVSRPYVSESYVSNGQSFERTKSIGNDPDVRTWSADNRVTEYRDRNGNLYQYSYDATGSVTKAVDPLGTSRTYTYDYKSNLTRVTDELNRQTTFSYDSRSNLTKVTDPASNSETYTYDSRGNRLTEANERGSTTTYEYNALNQLTKVIDPTTNSQTYTYDSVGNRLTETNEQGSTTTYQYDTIGGRGPVKITDPLGNSTTYQYDSNRPIRKTDERGYATTYQYDYAGPGRGPTKVTDPLGNSTTYEYDQWDNQTSKTDERGSRTVYEYDAYNRMVKVTDPQSNSTVYAYDSVGNKTSERSERGYTTTYTYDANDRLTKITDPQSNSTVYAYDSVGNKTSERSERGYTTTYTYDANNRLTKITDPQSNSVTYSYDAADNRTRETNERGYATTYTYDANNRLTKITDPQSNSTTYEYDPVGNLSGETDKRGNRTRYEYDADRRLRKVTDPTAGSASYQYDAADNRTSSTDERGYATSYEYDAADRLRKVTDPEGNSTTYGYDGSGRLTGVTDKSGSVTSYEYDARDRLVKTTDPESNSITYGYDACGNRTTQTDKGGNTTTYEYDARDQLEETTDPEGDSRTYEYDACGNLTLERDERGNRTTYEYDSRNNLQKVTGPDGSSATYQYDGTGNRTRETDRLGNATVYEYDSVDRPSRIVDAGGNSTRYEYDADGNRTRRTDANGGVTNYNYDALGRLSRRDYPGSNDDTFSYDRAGNLVSADNSVRSSDYSYDSLGRVASSTQAGEVVGYSHNSVNRERTLTYPTGDVVTETYSPLGKVARVTGAAGVLVQNAFDDGRLAQSALGNGLTTSLSYDALNRISAVRLKDGSLAVSGLQYGYDASGNKLYERREHDPSNSKRFTYDDRDRLVEYRSGTLDDSNGIPTPNTEVDYGLDAESNWRTKTVDGTTQTRAVNNLNQYTSIDATNLAHDSNGNLTDDGAMTYNYDYENRLTEITRKSDSSVVAQYAYDALGRRVEKSVGGTTTQFVYDGERLIAEKQGASTEATYTYTHASPTTPLTMTRFGETFYYHTDAEGSVDVITHSLGFVVEAYRYDAYGQPEIIVDHGADLEWFTHDDVTSTASAIGNPFMYRGWTYDAECGLYYSKAIGAYSPSLGRTISALADKADEGAQDPVAEDAEMQPAPAAPEAVPKPEPPHDCDRYDRWAAKKKQEVGKAFDDRIKKIDTELKGIDKQRFDVDVRDEIPARKKQETDKLTALLGQKNAKLSEGPPSRKPGQSSSDYQTEYNAWKTARAADIRNLDEQIKAQQEKVKNVEKDLKAEAETKARERKKKELETKKQAEMEAKAEAEGLVDAVVRERKAKDRPHTQKECPGGLGKETEELNRELKSKQEALAKSKSGAKPPDPKNPDPRAKPPDPKGEGKK